MTKVSAYVQAPKMRRRGGVFRRGSSKSNERMQELEFDPIEELVLKYRSIEDEIEFQEKWRTGEIVPLNKDGKTKAYYQEAHYALYDKLNNTAEKLLRYGYGRVPEVQEEEDKHFPDIHIHLSDEV